ncbi:hypothetical protein LTR78_005076 [Recurvomyces mirabilis]|uniref:LisH domain-containing protein n=1 Tax=Recurvomyces mirabilis TaxID=574656 RepID=A0AAE0WNU3_9PEZI|nr:hypothetical protein LTR78_005076 [Recurvomyces mirabilis]KAK5158307.1 hypothetical protein LTS14_003325 [Recurvomyces mirabilis]
MSTLHSDHINYLIWRYLQEHGHETAATAFQRDWQRPYDYRDPENLPFANVVKRDALISVVQDGLYFDQLSSGTRKGFRKYRWTGVNPRVAVDEQQRALSVGGEEDAEGEEVEDVRSVSAIGSRPGSSGKRKGPPPVMRAPDEFPTPAAKRQRRDESAHVNGDGDAMDVDEKSPRAEDGGDEDAEVASLEGGSEGGVPDAQERYDSMDVMTQTEVKVGPKTSTMYWKIDKPGATIYHSMWNPDTDAKNARSLLTVGEGLCRFYEVPEGLDGTRMSHVDDPYMPASGTVTASAWHPHGHSATCAMEAALQLSDSVRKPHHLVLNHGRERGSTVWDANPCMLEPPGVMICMRYSPSGTYILGLRTNMARGMVQIWKAPSAQGEDGEEVPYEPIAYRLFDTQALDACWTNDETFLICGDNLAAAYQLHPGQERTFHPPDPNGRGLVERSGSLIGFVDTWDKLRYDVGLGAAVIISTVTKTLVTIPLDSDLEVNMKAFTSIDGQHELPGQITAAAFQPRGPSSAAPPDPEVDEETKGTLIACTFAEGFCVIYSITRPEKGRTGSSKAFFLRFPAAALALAWSASGRYLAVGGTEAVQIYDVESFGPGQEVRMPLVNWPSDPGMFREKRRNGAVNGNHGEAGEEEEMMPPSLSWSSDGESLGFALERQIAVIRFNPPLHGDNVGQRHAMTNGAG